MKVQISLAIVFLFFAMRTTSGGTSETENEQHYSNGTIHRISTDSSCPSYEYPSNCHKTAPNKCIRVSRNATACAKKCQAYSFEDVPRPVCGGIEDGCKTKKGRRGYTLRCCALCAPREGIVHALEEGLPITGALLDGGILGRP